MNRPLTSVSDAGHAVQRLADSLQVLVLLLPTGGDSADPRSLLVAAAARQVLEDVEALRAQLAGARSAHDSTP